MRQMLVYLQLGAIRAIDLDREDIARESPRIDAADHTKTHCLGSLLDDIRKLLEVID